MKNFAIGLILLLFGVSAGAHDSPITYDRINVSVTDQEEVDNDVLVAAMYSQREGPRAASAANEVNKAIAWALSKAQSVAAVKAQTMQYTTSPVYRNQAITAWRVRQGLRLESRDAAALSELLALLQERLGIQSVDYTISPERRRQAEDNLIARALAAFRDRAQLIAGELGRRQYSIVNLTVSTGGSRPGPLSMRGARMAESTSVAAPALEAGVKTVNVSVSGTIELQPIQTP